MTATQIVILAAITVCVVVVAGKILSDLIDFACEFRPWWR
jgi:hypothetical protein